MEVAMNLNPQAIADLKRMEVATSNLTLVSSVNNMVEIARRRAESRLMITVSILLFAIMVPVILVMSNINNSLDSKRYEAIPWNLKMLTIYFATLSSIILMVSIILGFTIERIDSKIEEESKKRLEEVEGFVYSLSLKKNPEKCV